MKGHILIRIGGIFHFLCALIHIYFPKMFQWNEILISLQGKQRDIIYANLYILNYCLLFFWVMLAVIPFFFANDMIESRIGKTLLTFIVFFWIFRIFILQPIYVGFSVPGSIQSSLVFFAGLLLYLIPWMRSVILKKS